MDRPGDPKAGNVPAELRALLVCPIDHGDLVDDRSALVCRVCRRRYPVLDRVPDLRT